MVTSSTATSASSNGTGTSLQIHTPPRPRSQTQGNTPDDPEDDLSTEKGREVFWQHLLDRFKLLEWEQELERAQFHLLDAQMDFEAVASSEQPELNAETAASMASQIAGRTDDDMQDVASLVTELDNATAAALLADV